MYAYSAKEGVPLLGRASFVVTGPVKVLSARACAEKVQTVWGPKTFALSLRWTYACQLRIVQ